MATKSKDNSQQKKREIALDLYLNTDKSQKEICQIVGWTEKTFSTNKEKYGWESLKGANTITAQNIIKKLYQKLETLASADDIKPDALIKVAKSIEMMSDKKVTLSHHINCAKEFTSWVISKGKINEAKIINSLQYEFIMERGANA
ncbi:MAG: hypothetical protein IE931_05570 [Sphingobacteriales bacterium]|nr:hypothetical protein [Sphingobacteriales bacterium]